MSAPLVSAQDVSTGHDRPVHVVCCNDDVALCGADVANRPVLPDDTDVTCRICEIAYEEDLPCGNPECVE